ncbi:hypothetical protein H105_01320 [Trichophyton soudanense CBS 452.61]|uniref:Uncharacterized protein n=1 Tax=Trichophyton soudanense CBS 452.61 TaxID=1215331 RepID=A0A022Y4G3_TRISD|nr:hypothetical protein H105_01320 [Trichophyton soudanense CBS 452.61]
MWPYASDIKIRFPERLLWEEFEDSKPYLDPDTEYLPIPEFSASNYLRSWCESYPTPNFDSNRIYSSDYETLLYPPSLSSSGLHGGGYLSDCGSRCLQFGCGRLTQLGSYYCAAPAPCAFMLYELMSSNGGCCLTRNESGGGNGNV